MKRRSYTVARPRARVLPFTPSTAPFRIDREDPDFLRITAKLRLMDPTRLAAVETLADEFTKPPQQPTCDELVADLQWIGEREPRHVAFVKDIVQNLKHSLEVECDG